MSAELELEQIIMSHFHAGATAGSSWRLNPSAAASDILAAGYSKPRTISTPAEANALPDRAAFVTPGEIIFRKWAGYYGEGRDAWERELGQMVPAELLSAEGHFPATVLYTPKES